MGVHDGPEYAVQANPHEDHQRGIQVLWIEYGQVVANNALLFQSFYPLFTRCGAQADLSRQFGVAGARILLENAKDVAVDAIKPM